MTASRKEILEKEKSVVLTKDYAVKNPVLALEHVEELFNLFALYAEPRNKKTDVRDILITAKTLGLDTKYQLVFRALEEVADARHGDPIDFETFIRDLTAKLVHSLANPGQPLHRGRTPQRLPLAGRQWQERARHRRVAIHQRAAQIRLH